MICPVQATCGGCPNLHLDRDIELENKYLKVKRKFESVGIDIQIEPLGYESTRIRYRNRIRLEVKSGVVGFYNNAKRNGCLVLRDELWNAVCLLKELTFSKPSLLKAQKHVELRVSDLDEIGLYLPETQNLNTINSHFPDNWFIGCSNVAVKSLTYILSNEIEIKVPLNSFVQINSTINRQLNKYVIDKVTSGHTKTFIDLFSGAGNYSVPLLNKGLCGVAVESNRSSLHELKKYVSPGKFKIFSGEVSDYLNEMEQAEVLISNPPRAGIKSGYKNISDLFSRRIIHISCDIDNFVKDLRYLADEALTVEDVKLFDMFPGTEHLELVATLSK